MIRGNENGFIGMTAVVLGLILLACAVTNSQWYYSLTTASWLSKRLGRGGARLFHALLGCGLIALGMAIIGGLRWTLIGS